MGISCPRWKVQWPTVVCSRCSSCYARWLAWLYGFQCVSAYPSFSPLRYVSVNFRRLMCPVSRYSMAAASHRRGFWSINFASWGWTSCTWQWCKQRRHCYFHHQTWLADVSKPKRGILPQRYAALALHKCTLLGSDSKWLFRVTRHQFVYRTLLVWSRCVPGYGSAWTCHRE